MRELDFSRPIRRPSDQRGLVQGILDGSLGVDETTWIEWKSQVDWDIPEDVGMKVARQIIGFANRDPIEAQAFVGGEAYLVFLHDPGRPYQTEIDPSDIENKVSPYLGTDGPQWSPSYVVVEGRRSLMITVAPPPAGDHIHALRKQAGKYPNGAVFVRRPGKTEQANATDVRRLEQRAHAAASPIAIEVIALTNTIQRLNVDKDMTAFIAAERDRLLGPLAIEESRVGGGQREVLEMLMGQGILGAYQERRKPSEFREECEKYFRDVADMYSRSAHHMAALKGFGAVQVRVVNPTARNLLGVEVELLIPNGVLASRGRPDEPKPRPQVPTPWGTDSAIRAMVSPSLSWAIPSQVARPSPRVWHLGSGQGLVFDAFDLRPYKDHVLPTIHLFGAQSLTNSSVDIRWRATAQNTDSRAEGEFTLEIGESELTLRDLTEGA